MTISEKSRTSVNVGVDVGKEMLESVSIKRGSTNRTAIRPMTLRALRRLGHYKVERLVMEATD